jgi:succinate dehydrogenase/fumarate reductase flavoprotein subunit
VAAGAVVVAAGGFVMNADMVAAHTPRLAEKSFALGSTYDDGLGIRLGASVGAALEHMDEPFITAPFYPPSSLVTGVLVNREGRRFVAEDSYHSRTSQHVMEQPGSTAYLVVDSAHVEYPRFPLVPLLDGFETIAELETALDLPPGSVAATLERYDAMAAAGEDLDFHKAPEWLAPQDTGPWAVFDLRLGHAMYAGFTLGGIRVSVDGAALRADGSVVAGLFAAGACASNLAQDGNGYCSGTQLGEGSFFGRRAGRTAASTATVVAAG